MKKKTIFLIMLILACFLVYPQSRTQLDRVFEFEYDLDDISEALPEQMGNLKNKFFVISASVDNIEITNKDAETFEAVITVLYGKWDGFDEIKTYKADMYFSGPQFAPIIPVRPPRTIPPGMIVANSNITILCQLTGMKERDGLMIPVFDVYKVKVGR
jgi:hypothetical protein